MEFRGDSCFARGIREICENRLVQFSNFIYLALDIYGLFKLVFHWLWVVVVVFEVVAEFFEVVVGGFRWS